MAVTSPPYWLMRKYSGHSEEIGLETTREEYIAAMVETFAALRRVLRDDGTFFMNIGDSYLGGKRGGTLGMPWRLALAMEDDGWTLRQEIIWRKTTAMPDGSAHNRCVKAHEQVFMFTKKKGYFFDADAIRNETGSLRRSVWDIANPGFKGAHYAVYPEKLVDMCVSAGTSEQGCCSRCGVQYKRITRKVGGSRVESEDVNDRDRSYDWSRNGMTGTLDGAQPEIETVGWETGCECGADSSPSLVLDPFSGSGTTAAVCIKRGRRCVGIELSTEYLTHDAVPRLERTIASVSAE